MGPALGQHGVNIMEFCKGFNAQTGNQEGLILPVVVTIYQDRSFTFVVKTPPAAILLKRAAGIAKASAVPHKDKIGKVTRAAGARDRPDQAGGPEHRLHRVRHAHRRGHRPQHGHRSRLKTGRQQDNYKTQTKTQTVVRGLGECGGHFEAPADEELEEVNG